MRHRKRQVRIRQLWFSHWNMPAWRNVSPEEENRQPSHSSR